MGNKTTYIITQGNELFKYNPSDNTLINLCSWDLYQRVYGTMYYIEEAGVINYMSKVDKENRTLDVEAGDLIFMLEDNRPEVIHDKIFANTIKLYLDNRRDIDQQRCNIKCSDCACEKTLDRD